MEDLFSVAGASVPGTDHTQPGKPGWKNNQDAFTCIQTPELTIGIIADGCGSGKGSEVGAQLGVKILAAQLQKLLQRSISTQTPFGSWKRLEQLLLSHIQINAESMGESLSGTIGEYFLFSIVGFAITPETTWIFHCGDGTFALNAELTKLGPFPQNAPPYLAYRINGSEDVSLTVHAFPTNTVDTIAIGTDGTDHIPGFGKELIREWLKRDAFFSNPDSLRRMLALTNRERIEGGQLLPGPLKDDTTIVLVRRKTN